MISALTDGIKAQMTAKAIKSEAEMVASATHLRRAYTDGHDAQTDWENRDLTREEKTTRKKTDVEKAALELDEVKAKRAYEAKLPRNETDREFEERLKPSVRNEDRTKVYQANSRAEAMIEAAQAAFELEAKIDKGPGTPDQKAELKRKVRQTLDATFEEPKAKAASSSPYADERREDR